MRRIRGRLALTVFMLGLLAFPLFSGPTKASNDFVIDGNKPFVYVRFDHVGPGAPRSEGEPPTRIWLSLVNNCRVPIVVRTNGVPDESPKEELGLEYDVVANRPVKSMALIPEKNESNAAQLKASETEALEIPRGYIEEVASTQNIGPSESGLFSIPLNHLSKRWHIEIPFEFEVPRGQGPHDDRAGGIPVMIVEYTLYDLPPKSQAEIPAK